MFKIRMRVTLIEPSPGKSCATLCPQNTAITALDHYWAYIYIYIYMGGCQNYGPFSEPYYYMAPNM